MPKETLHCGLPIGWTSQFFSVDGIKQLGFLFLFLFVFSCWQGVDSGPSATKQPDFKNYNIKTCNASFGVHYSITGILCKKKKIAK